MCGGFFPPVDVLCKDCWAYLDSIAHRGSDLRRPGYRFPVYSLLTWSEKDEAFLRPLVHALKGGRGILAIEALVKTFSYERVLLGRPGSQTLVIPPRRKNLHDHAWVIGESFSRTWQIKLWDGFSEATKSQEISQKQRVAAERFSRRFELKPGVRRPSRGKIVFVDDVITTGATATAAYMALDDPKDFEVWTLFDRPKLAAPRRF